MGAGLKNLSSKEVISIFGKFGFVVHSQKGSHIKLRREGAAGKETLTIPERKQIAKGTLNQIFKQASSYIPQAELHPHFHNDER
jgi:predicted RNA binding protein YcfA (HicA-like mRNA interferase family)